MKLLQAARTIIIVLLAAAPAVSYAQTAGGPQFYVAPGGNDAGPGSYAQPWRTIQKAMNSATPGSTVNIGAGVYSERLVLNVSGTPGYYITFQPYGFTGLAQDGTPGGASIAANGYKPCVGDPVTIDYSSLGVVTDHIPFLNINGASYVRIQGLRFQNFTCYGSFQQGVRIDGGSHDIEFLCNMFINNQNTYPVRDGTAALCHFRIYTASNITVRGNEFGYIVTSTTEAFTMDSAGSTGTLVESNWFHDTDGIAIDIYGGAQHATIIGNLLERISEKADGSFWYNQPTNAIYVDGGNTSVITGNLVRNSGWAYTVLAEPGQPAAHDIVVRDNVAYGNAGGAITVGTWYSSTDGSSVYNVQVLNNTLYANRVGFNIRPYVSSGVVWENNLVAENTANTSNMLNWPVGVMDYNLYYGGRAGPDVHQVTANPLFTNVNTSEPDLSLQSNSPAINAGNPSFVPGSGETDFAGNPRVVGGRVDIGAFEAQ